MPVLPVRTRPVSPHPAPIPFDPVTALKQLVDPAIYAKMTSWLVPSHGLHGMSNPLFDDPKTSQLIRPALALTEVLFSSDDAAVFLSLSLLLQEAPRVREADDVPVGNHDLPRMRIGDAIADGALALVTRDTFLPVKAFAIRVAAAMSPKKAIATLQHYLGDRHAEPMLRLAAADAMAAIPEVAETQRDLLLELLHSDTEDAAVVKALLPVFPKLSWAKDALQIRLQKMETQFKAGASDTRSRAQAVTTASEIGEAAIPTLEKLISDSKLYNRHMLVQVLGDIGAKALPVLLRLTQRVGDSQVMREADLQLLRIDPLALAEHLVTSEGAVDKTVYEFLKKRVGTDREIPAARAVLLHLDSLPDYMRPTMRTMCLQVSHRELARLLVADYLNPKMNRESVVSVLRELGSDAVEVLLETDLTSVAEAGQMVVELAHQAAAQVSADFVRGRLHSDHARHGFRRLGAASLPQLQALVAGADTHAATEAAHILASMGPPGYLALREVETTHPTPDVTARVRAATVHVGVEMARALAMPAEGAEHPRDPWHDLRDGLRDAVGRGR